MISIHVLEPVLEGTKNYAEGSCLSTDDKPTEYANGSKMLEMDTSKLFVFDEANNTWREWA